MPRHPEEESQTDPHCHTSTGFCSGTRCLPGPSSLVYTGHHRESFLLIHLFLSVLGFSPWILGSLWVLKNYSAVSVTCWGVGNSLSLSNPSPRHLFSRIWWLPWAGGGQEIHSHCSDIQTCLWFCCCPKAWSENRMQGSSFWNPPTSTVTAFSHFHSTLIKE